MANWDVLLVGEGRQLSEIDETEVRRMLSQGELQPEDCLRRVGETRWRRVSDLRNRGARGEEQRVRQEEDAQEEEAQEVRGAAPAMMAGAAVVGGVPGAAHTHEEEEELGSWTPQLHVDELDMTPMVDVVLLLLLFFMVTASYMMQKVIEIPKPNPDKNRATAKTRNELMKEYVMVEIDQRNNFSVEDEPLKGMPLKDAIKRASEETGKKKVFVIAEGDCFHGSVVTALDAATEAKAEAPILLSVRTDD
jgi:biopolymer transport protein ExbD